MNNFCMKQNTGAFIYMYLQFIYSHNDKTNKYFKLASQHITPERVFDNLIYISRKYFRDNNYYISHIMLELINIMNAL